MQVPLGAPAGFTLMSLPPANSTRMPSPSSVVRVSRTRRETAVIEGNASPRKPRVEIEMRSSALRSFDVAWRSKQSRASSWFIPQPSSVMRMRRLPPDSVSMRMERAPASRAFSRSSLTTEAGRSTTSPAAILLATFSGRMRILDTLLLTSLSLRFLGLWLNHDPEFVELGSVDIAGRLGHQVNGGGRFRERDYFADRFFAGEDHSDAIEAKRDSAVRRRSIRERVEKEPEPALGLLFAEAERFEHARLHVLPMNSDAAGAEFISVEDEIVAFRAAFPRCGFELVEVFFVNTGERMLRAHPALFGFAPFEDSEAGDPGEFPFDAVDLVEFVTEVETDLPSGEERRIRVRDLLFGWGSDDQVAGFCAHFGDQLFEAVGAEILFEWRSNSFRCDLYGENAASAG